MDGLELIQRASAAGLTLKAVGDRLIVHGPTTAEPLVRELLDHKVEVLAALHDRSELPAPTACARCGSLEVWWNGLGTLRCMWCEPPTAAFRLLVRTHEIRSRHSLDEPASETTEPSAEPACRRCRSTAFTDVRIHGGRSSRRDCANCGQVFGFPVWFGRETN